MNIWARKSTATLIEEARAAESLAVTEGEPRTLPLRRTLTASNLVSLGVGGVIGAGIFVMTGQAAATNAGPAITLSFVLAGLTCAFAALCYAEMAAAVPVAGSAYTFAYVTMGVVLVVLSFLVSDLSSFDRFALAASQRTCSTALPAILRSRNS